MGDRRIIVIGNGSSVLDHEYGSIIDSGEYDVCRFNNFRTEGFEKHIGSRTDILCRRACDDVRIWDSPTLQKVYTFVTYCRWSAGMIYVARNIESYYGDRCELVNLKECRQIGELLELDQPENEWASVGALFIGYIYLTNPGFRDKLILHGFDDVSKKNSHYFQKQPRDACYHNWVKESRFIQKLGLKTLRDIVNDSPE